MIKLLTKWALEHAGWQCVPWALADSHIWVLNPVGVFAVLLLLKCDSSQQFFVLQRPKMKPYNICRLFCGQCLTVTSKTNWTGRQLHHHQALVRSPSLDIETHLPNWWVPLVLIQKMSHYLKKKSFCGMRQWWYLFYIHRGARAIHECRKSSCLLCCLLTLSGLGSPSVFTTII